MPGSEETRSCPSKTGSTLSEPETNQNQDQDPGSSLIPNCQPVHVAFKRTKRNHHTWPHMEDAYETAEKTPQHFAMSAFITQH